MTNLCYNKCVKHYNENDLNVGESSCLDRCIGKYLSAQNSVGEIINKFENQLQAQQQMLGQQNK